MKYILLSVAAVAVVFGLSFLLTGLIRKKQKKKLPLILHILISVGIGLLIFCVAGFCYLNIHYTAREEALAVMSDSAAATVTEIDGGYFVDGAGQDTALIFYPGAKVDAQAYLPLMQEIATGGVDCFLLDLPMRMAIFDQNAADKIMAKVEYPTVMVGGHSMGGMIAAGYAAAHKDSVDGVVLLAAYPTKPLDKSLGLLSVYGTEDKVLDRDAYENAKAYFPSNTTETVIDGGNHAQFGNYGAQKGDGEAAITAKEQQRKTAYAVLRFAETLSNR
ncbi:alpha/beta fold hydrolase [Ruminococcus sp.]|uniref:alpha/beta fold hydrolase n=1 Tax=Ruminococcus sp. TaxID=41978 RepID=UPI00386CA65D